MLLTLDFLANKLRLNNPGNILLQTATSFKTVTVKKPRDIMVRFLCINDRNNAWKNRFNLKGSAYILAEDFPPVI